MKVQTLIGFAFVMTVGTACAAEEESPRTTLTIDGDRATVRGVVRENVKGCEVDGTCYLVLSSERGDVRVEYHHGEWPPCDNLELSRAGIEIAAGTTIDAQGRYSAPGQRHQIDVCCPECSLSVVHDR